MCDEQVAHTCSEVPAPMSRPRDCATRHVCVDNVMNMKKRRKSFGWFVIQYTMVPYSTGNITCKYAIYNTRSLTTGKEKSQELR